MIIAVYFDLTTGRIRQILPFDDGTASATIDGFAEPGTDWLDLPDANITEDYIDDPSGTPTLTERPVLYDTDRVALLPDGSETITFPVPSGTLVDFEDADDYTTAGADFSFTPPGIGEWVIGLEPPWPYVPLLLTVTAVTRQVQTDGIASKAITPSKYDTNPAGNLVVDYELTDPTLWSFREFTAYSGGSLPTAEVDAVPVPDAQITHEINPTVDDYGPSDWRFIAEVSEPQSALIFETGVSMPVDPGERFRASVLLEVLDTDATHYANNAVLYLQYFRLDAAGVAEYVSTATVDSAGLSVPAGAPQKVRLSAVVTAPAGVSYATLYVKISPTASSPSPYTIRALIASPSLRHTAQVSDFAQVVSFYNGATNVTFGSGAGGAQIALVDIEAGEYDNGTAKSAIFSISFRNNSGSAITVGVEINKMLGGSVPTPLFDIPAVTIGNGAMFSYTYRHASFISRGTDDAIEVRLYGSASGNSVHEISFVVDMRQ